MPSPAHEIPLQLIHDNPSLLIALLQKLGRPAPEGPLVPDDANLRFADPAEVRPDIVFRAVRPPWVIFELQNAIYEAKGRRWLLAAGILINQPGGMGEAIVLTSSRRVARWAKRVARMVGEYGTVVGLKPIVLLIAGDTIDALLDEEQPELAFFAAWAVRSRRGPKALAVVDRASELAERLPLPLQGPMLRAIFGVLGEHLVAYLKDAEMNSEQLPETRAARRFRTFYEERGKTEGLAEGKREGLAEGKREALLVLLGARGLAVSDTERAAIAACSDAAQLDRWIARAVTATSAAEVLDAPVRPRSSTRRRTAHKAR